MALRTSYHDLSFNHAERALKVQGLVKTLERFAPNIGIVCTGLSGILVAVPVADHTKREFAVLRKPNDGSHSCYEVEGYTFSEYVIIDDFMSTGDTIRRIIDAMSQRDGSVCKAVLLYDTINRSVDPEFEHKGQCIPVVRFEPHES